MTLPWPHRLPDYAGEGPYGQNLVQLAAALSEPATPVTVLDVGANVGDSALQILHATDAQVLCVEADPYFLEYLHINVDQESRVDVVEALLTYDPSTAATTAVRTGGTTRFAEGAVGDALPTVTPEELRERFPGVQEPAAGEVRHRRLRRRAGAGDRAGPGATCTRCCSSSTTTGCRASPATTRSRCGRGSRSSATATSPCGATAATRSVGPPSTASVSAPRRWRRSSACATTPTGTWPWCTRTTPPASPRSTSWCRPAQSL